MANGDAAAAVGLPVVAASKDKRLGYDDINALADKLALHMTDGTHPASKITGQIQTGQIADGSVTSAKITDLTVSTQDVKDQAITTGKIALKAVTAARIADETVTGAQVADRLAKDARFSFAGSPASLETAVNAGNHFVQVANSGISIFEAVEGIDVTAAGDVTVTSGDVITLAGGSATFKVGATSEGDRVVSESIRSNTTAATANVFIDPTTGIMRRVNSASASKRDVRDAPPMPAVLRLRPRTWEAAGAPPDDHTRYLGLVASEVHALGLRMLVSYSNGSPEAVAYDRIVVALVPIIADLVARVIALEHETAAPSEEV